MNLQFIKYFLVLAEMKNFTRASERVHVVQSTFSMGIKKLEESLNAQLFKRDKRNVELTTEGKILLPKAKELLSQWFEIEEEFLNTESKRLEIGFLQNLSIEVVIPILDELKNQRPGIELNIYEEKHATLIQMLQTCKIDAFFSENRPVDKTSFKIKKVASEKLFLAVHKSNSLVKENKALLKTLHKERFIERSHCALYQDVFERLKQEGIRPNKVYIAHNNETVAALISANMGVSLMPKPMFDTPDIRFIELKDATFVREINLIWRKDSSNKALQTLLTCL